MVIVLDDGIATGSTMIAALRAGPRTPSRQGDCRDGSGIEGDVGANGSEVDEVVCLEVPELLYANRCVFRRFRPGLR